MSVPRHVAIVMDGNGRWAKKRFLPRQAGHRAGVDNVKEIVKACDEQGIEVLTLFAFSSENWNRPKDEVSYLMRLFVDALRKQIRELHERNVRIRFIGERTAFSQELQHHIEENEELTHDNTGPTLIIAANYGGQWDIVEAARQLAKQVESGQITADSITSECFSTHLSLHDYPPPDLLIRTGNERRISNFLLWDAAYSEFYFTATLWPDFDKKAFLEALTDYSQRERRFGQTSEQVSTFKADPNQDA